MFVKRPAQSAGVLRPRTVPSSPPRWACRPAGPARLTLLVAFEARAHEGFPVVPFQRLRAGVGVALLHLLLLRRRLRRLALQARRHEGFALVALLVPCLRVARLHALLLRSDL